ncbi:glycosyltransferase [Fibrella sp. HMF5335]|uniref:Glycosyltransferase n=1 Tax=Fibrella rubiginis TaxID=2817060 RepID=A0A939K4V6_9BACT|nr:glycosyltransferase [Fibrella rubiginis]MBO0938814.1 glycosyltransferase [Fibrella rubiginis]
MPAPIILFAYKRPSELRRTLLALQANFLATESELYVFVDGPKHPSDSLKVEQVRAIAEQITGFRNVYLHISTTNMGCANSIINGVSQVLREHPNAVVLEEDIVTTPNFLDFINQSLMQYASHPKVFSVGGYTFPFEHPTNYVDDVYFYGRTCAWGWGIWADRWFATDWSIADFEAFMADSARRKAFNYYGSDRVRMLRRSVEKEIDTWDIRLCYEQFKQKKLTAYPTISKVENIGFYSNDGANTNVYNRYQTQLDDGLRRRFILPERVDEHSTYTRQFQHQFSLGVRLFNRLKTVAGLR